MSKPVCVLFRDLPDYRDEFLVASHYFDTFNSRVRIPGHRTVLARYSVLPFYEEVERDLAHLECKLLNTLSQHRFIANVLDWGSEHGCLSGLTPRTWPDWSNLPEGAYVLKGSTNSRKDQWLTHMYAPTRADIPNVARRLLDDPHVSSQGLVVREYVPLRKLGEGLSGIPIANEWRTFWVVTYPNEVRKVTCVGAGFYWTNHPEIAIQFDELPPEAEALARKGANLIADYANFFVLDVAEKEGGGWIIVEVNDGQMSGLSGVNAHSLYRNLRETLQKE